MSPRDALGRLVESVVQAAPRELPQVARIVVAGTVSWLIAAWLGAPEPPVYAVLVPLLAMREDPYAAFNVSLGRLVGVIAGVLIGVAVLDLFSSSFGAGILLLAVSLVVGMVLRVGGALNVQVAVSAFIVFAVQAATGSDIAWTRLWETVVGAAVTVVLAPLLFPPNPVRLIERRLDRLGQLLHDALISVVEAPGQRDEVGGLVETARALRADDAQAQRSARWNPLQRRLRPALCALEGRVELAGLLAIHVHALATDLVDLSTRGHRDAVLRRRPVLLAIATPLAAAIQSALAGRHDAGDLQRVETAVATDQAADDTPVAVVSRHPLIRLHSVLVPQ
ncbi:MAG: FUSC family protein [Ilumatobacteraceae bacterium]